MQHDCVLFDVDGVLVDVSKSYNSAIKKTVNFCCKQLVGKTWPSLVTDRLILRFRQRGGFNNDADTSYAMLLSTIVNPPATVSEGRKFLETIAANADETGIVSVEKFLENRGFEISKFRDQLAYPGSVRESIVARVFDEFFYGPELFKGQNGLGTKYWDGSKPLIDNDKVIVTARTLKFLCSNFAGNLAMVTGRSRIAAEYSLRKLMRHFDLRASVFLEDESRQYAKPNPYAIIRAMRTMDARKALYAGDSLEDLLMARKAQAENLDISFVGIYGCSPLPAQTRRQLSAQTNWTLKNVNALPRLVKQLQN